MDGMLCAGRCWTCTVITSAHYQMWTLDHYRACKCWTSRTTSFTYYQRRSACSVPCKHSIWGVRDVWLYRFFSLLLLTFWLPTVLLTPSTFSCKQQNFIIARRSVMLSEQEQPETAYLCRGESGQWIVDPSCEPSCGSGWLPKFKQFFIVHRYICGKIFMKIHSVVFT